MSSENNVVGPAKLTTEKKNRGVKAMLDFLYVAVVISTPKLLSTLSPAEWHRLKTRRVVSVINRYLALLNAIKTGAYHDASGILHGTEENTRKFRDLYRTWEPSHHPPREIVQAARDLIEDFGWSAPTDKGWRGDKKETPDPSSNIS